MSNLAFFGKIVFVVVVLFLVVTIINKNLEINDLKDKEKKVNLLIEENVLKEEFFACHPMVNTATVKFKTEDLVQLAFELERNDPAIGDTYRDTSYEGQLDWFVEQYVDRANHYYDEVQAEFVFDFIS